MAKKVTLKTIAADLKLSVGTVSRVLNGKAKEFRISDKTVKSVMNYAKDNNYSPNMVAKGLRASRTFSIGLMIPDIANPFFSMMAKHIEKAASAANYSILLVDAEENVEKEKQQVRNMLNRQVDAIIAAPVGISFDHFKEITKIKIPIIFVDRYFNNSSIPYVTSDNFNGGYIATKHLIENGHQRIALLNGFETIEPVKERRRGYQKAIEEAGIFADESLIVGVEFGVENGFKYTKELLQLKNRPTAIFAMSNLIGLGVLQAVKEEGLTIPNDISLIIFDDQPYVSYLNPPITTVKQNSEIIGEYAVEYILNRIEDESYETDSKIIPIKLIERNSVCTIR
jgi:LacI family transcriptional regulator